jgi:SAM-dependent methyltransferase
MINPDILQCPICSNKIIYNNNNYICSNHNCYLNIILYNNKLVLIDFNNSVCKIEKYLSFNPIVYIERKNIFKYFKKIINYNIVFKSVINIKKIDNYFSKKVKTLIIGGGTIGNGTEFFYNNNNKYEITCFDIYDSKYVDFISDAHSIPIKDNSFDLVIIQAVLEHVVNPTLVVSEIYRILKFDGYVYSETPFLQQVHEGPYDFTRFTNSGQILLFNNFKLIESGYIAGVISTFLLSLENLITSIFRSKYIGKIIRYSLFWLSYFDSFIDTKYHIDGGSCFFYIGKKLPNKNLIEVSEIYKGAQN